MRKSKEKREISAKEANLDFKDLEFEEVLADLLQIKPVENSDLKKAAPKKKSKPKTKK